MNIDYDDMDDLAPEPRKRTRRDRLLDEMTEVRRHQREWAKHKRKSKPKGFKHNRRKSQKGI